MYDFEHHRRDMLDLVVREYEAVLQFNEVQFLSAELLPESHSEYESSTLARISYLRQLLPVTSIAQHTFQLLFRDR